MSAGGGDRYVHPRYIGMSLGDTRARAPCDFVAIALEGKGRSVIGVSIFGSSRLFVRAAYSRLRMSVDGRSNILSRKYLKGSSPRSA